MKMIHQIKILPDQIERFNELVSLNSETMQLIANYGFQFNKETDSSDVNIIDVSILESVMLLVENIESGAIACQHADATCSLHAIIFFCMEHITSGNFASKISYDDKADPFNGISETVN